MTKYFRIGMMAALLGGLAAPAFAQTPAPAAPTTATAAPDTATTPDANTPDANKTEAKPAAPVKKTHHVRKHHVVAQKKTVDAPDTAGQTKR